MEGKFLCWTSTSASLCVVAVEGFKVTLNECFVYVTLSIVIGDLNPTGFDRNINWENPL